MKETEKQSFKIPLNQEYPSTQSSETHHQTTYFGNQSFISTIFFLWLSPMMTHGSKFEFTEKIIPKLKPSQRPKAEFQKLYNTFSTIEKSKKEGFTMLRSIFKTFKKDLLIVLFLSVLYLGLEMYAPIMMNQIMNYAKEQDKTTQKSIFLFFLCFFAYLLISFSVAHISYIFSIFGFNLSNALTLMIYNKSLKHPLLASKKYKISNIINFAQVDAQRMTYMNFNLVQVVIAPFQVIISLFLLYYYIGVSFLVGAGVMLVIVVLTGGFGTVLEKVNDDLLKVKDERMEVAEEIIQIMKFIKTNAQEKYFFNKLNEKREEQLRLNKKAHILNVILLIFFFASAPLIIFCTFLLYIHLDNEINASKAFTTILLFRLLQYPITSLSNTFLQLTQAWASVKRVERFLLADDIDSSYISKNEPANQEYAITIEKGTFLWGVEQKDDESENQEQNQKSMKPISKNETNLRQSLVSEQQESEQKEDQPEYIQALKNINLKIRSGTVTMVVGDIGSGKSSLLYAILNQMIPNPESSPKINIYGDVAFCSQKPWIISGTVKENILFFLPEDKEKLKKVIYYASLQEDLKILGKGMDTQIGQRGVNLSGGQKARISLARALYSDRDIYLLDDVLSAVDVHVGKFLMEETILGYLRNKTVIMPTHAVHFAEQADRIIVMKKGEIIKEGKFGELFETEEFQQICKFEKKKSEQQSIEKEEEKILKQLKIIKQTSKNNEKQEEIEQNSLIQKLIIPQDQQKGQVKWSVYKNFIKQTGGLKTIFVFVVCLSGWAVLSTLSNIQIQLWCEDPSSESSQYLVLYIVFEMSSILFMIIQSYVLVIVLIKLGKKIHSKIMKSLLYASIPEFYNRVPVGRILNRISSNLREVDESVGEVIFQALIEFFVLLSTLFICIYASTVLTLIPIVIIFFICYKLQKYYLKSQRECIRLENINNSFIVSGFTEAVHGAATVRSYCLQEEFLAKQIQRVDTYKRFSICREGMESWFSLRLGLLGFVITMLSVGFSIFTKSDNQSLLGLLLIYALNLSDDVIRAVLSYVHIEKSMISVERTFQFTKIQPQAGYEDYCKNWDPEEEGYEKEVFSKSSIKFNNFSARYRKDLPIILDDISLFIKQGEKVGIVGRTGAGKSTLFNCLLRIIDLTEGTIYIGQKNIKEYTLKNLRSNITMIDQEPTLINGTFRENLDPSQLYTDTELQQVIEECNIAEIIQGKGGLDAKASNENLSIGERQLLCICRAFLKKSKIVLIDEATANIDVKNDQIIQQVLHSKFGESTVLTIAHRLSTLKDSDKILVLGNGKVLEWGSPKELLEKQKGIYKEMCEKNDISYLK